MNYSVYRCVDPVATKTSPPWYTNTDSCPCDPKLGNPSGRGFTSCPSGVNLVNTGKKDEFFGPPQFEPRQLVRIGHEWRN